MAQKSSTRNSRSNHPPMVSLPTATTDPACKKRVTRPHLAPFAFLSSDSPVTCFPLGVSSFPFSRRRVVARSLARSRMRAYIRATACRNLNYYFRKEPKECLEMCATLGIRFRPKTKVRGREDVRSASFRVAGNGFASTSCRMRRRGCSPSAGISPRHCCCVCCH